MRHQLGRLLAHALWAAHGAVQLADKTSERRSGGLSPRLIEPGRTTVASLLKQQGYHTACVGKWHLGMDWVRLPGFNTPHSPFAVPEAYWERFRDKPLPLRTTEGREDLAVTCAVRWPCARTSTRTWAGCYAGLMLSILARGTRSCCISADNGPNSLRWNGGMKGRKGSTDEGACARRYSVAGPAKIKSGTVIRQIAGAIDLLPTLTGLTGVSPAGTKPLGGGRGIDHRAELPGKQGGWPGRARVGPAPVRQPGHDPPAAGRVADEGVPPVAPGTIRLEQGAARSRSGRRRFPAAQSWICGSSQSRSMGNKRP